MGTAPTAKPLLDSSEESYASVCIGYDDTSARLIEICQRALQEPGASASQRADMRDSLGNAYYDQSRLDEAEAEFRLNLEQNPNSPRALKGLGWVAQERGHYEQARDYFQQSVDIAATDTALAGLGYALWKLRAVPVDEAIAYMDAALALSPEYLWAERQKGWILLDVDRAEEALDLFEAMARKYPADQYSQAGLVSANRALGRYEKALEHANRGIELSDGGYWYLSQRSHLLYAMGRYRQAIRDADQLIEMAENDAEGYVRKARAMAMIGARKDALTLLHEAAEKTGHNAFLSYWHASILIDDEQYDAALIQLKKNTGTESADADDYELLALTQFLRGDYARARLAVDRALAMNAEMPYTIYYDAILMLEENKGVQAAMERFDQALKAGLPDSNIGNFASRLIDAGFMVHAIAIRAKYAN